MKQVSLKPAVRASRRLDECVGLRVAPVVRPDLVLGDLWSKGEHLIGQRNQRREELTQTFLDQVSEEIEHLAADAVIVVEDSADQEAVDDEPDGRRQSAGLLGEVEQVVTGIVAQKRRAHIEISQSCPLECPVRKLPVRGERGCH